MADERDDRATAAVIAKLLMITTRRVQQLAQEGVIPKAEHGAYPLVASVQGYIRFLQTRDRQGAKRLDEDARLRAAQADLRQLELAKARSELVTVASAESVLTSVGGAMRSRLATLSSRMAGVLVGRSVGQIKQALDDEADAIQRDIYDRLGKLVASVAARARLAGAARKKKSRPVGRRKPRAAEGERGAGSVPQ